MRIRELSLYTNKLEAEKEFYTKVLGFSVWNATHNQFTLKIGWTALTFVASQQAFCYHYCFLIPSNKLTEAVAWLEKRTSIIPITSNKKTNKFEDWNAESVYFCDASGNIVEFIVRYDLDNATYEIFNKDQILCVNEIGLATNDIKKVNFQLEVNLGTSFYKGDFTRFGTHGHLEGLFLLPNYNEKTTWFPTNAVLKPQSFTGVVESYKGEFLVNYNREKLKIEKRVQQNE
ncbi:VOC family protein [Aquimarina agarilytica]|uniref:VOC family protein n=1 Tax=Aquimarina agarilytica TaxID=1087449 RepID=UPI000287D9BE|nr:glyoxalase [Aquimarina agarilytica]